MSNQTVIKPSKMQTTSFGSNFDRVGCVKPKMDDRLNCPVLSCREKGRFICLRQDPRNIILLNCCNVQNWLYLHRHATPCSFLGLCILTVEGFSRFQYDQNRIPHLGICMFSLHLITQLAYLACYLCPFTFSLYKVSTSILLGKRGHSNAARESYSS